MNLSQFLVFPSGSNSQFKECSIVINNMTVCNTSSAVHLGHHISTQDKSSLVSAANAQFWKSFNILRADFGHIKSSLQCLLFKQYCCSFYGAPLWSLRSKAVMTLCTSWRKALRKIWGVHYMTHCNIVALLSDCPPLENALKYRFQKFHECIMRTGSDFMKLVIMNALRNPFSVFCDNRNEVNCFLEGEMNTKQNDDTVSVVNVLKELIEIRNQVSVCDMFSLHEVEQMIEDICIS